MNRLPLRSRTGAAAWRVPSFSPARLAIFTALALLTATPLQALAHQQTCQVIDPDGDSPISRLWQGAAGALSAVAGGEEDGRYELEVVLWNRAADLASDLVLGEQVSEPVEMSHTLEAPPVEELLRGGWIQASDDGAGHDYFGLDAAALVSDDFLKAHCFELREDPRDGSPVELAFQPEPGTDRPGVRGTLRLDRETGALVDLRYQYTAHPDELEISADDAPRFGGTVEFRQLPDGGWIADRWTMRMPWWWQDPDRGEQLGSLERGGEVVRVRTTAGVHVPDRARAAVEGIVLDSTRMEGLEGADVHLLGTSHVAHTDRDGRFRIEVPSEGTYLANFSHPRLDTLGVEDLPDVEATLARGHTARLDLGGPSVATLAAFECGREVGGGPEGILIGRVLEAGLGMPMGGASVRVMTRGDPADGRPVTGEGAPHEFEAVTDPDGHFRFCEVPSDVLLRVETELLGVTNTPEEIRLAEGEARSLELTVRLGVAGELTVTLGVEAELRGTVREGETGPVISNASVQLSGFGEARSTTSDAQGRFTIADVRSGRYDLRVSHIGFREMTTEVVVADGERATDLTVRLLRDAIALEPIVVEVDARPSWGPLAQVYERRDYMERLGIGRFFDREDIDRVAGAQVTRMISRRMPGVRWSPVGAGFRGRLQIHRTNPCEPAFFVDGMPIRLMGETMDDIVSLHQLEMVEVYRSAAQLPIEYATDQAANCGAVAVWTRRGH